MTTVAAADATLRVPTSPYKGLVPYAAEDAPFFFGRDEWREIIIDNLRAYRLTLLYGASGIGKSSVLHAGVVHDLRERAQRSAADTGSPGLVIVVFRTWREDPLGGLVRALRDATDEALGERTPVDPEASHDLPAALEECARRVGGKVFVVLDQFEEYFLYHAREDDGDHFGAALVAAVNQRALRASFLISIREDAVAKLDRFKGQLPSLFDNYLRIEQLDRDEAREAVEKPLEEYARRSGRRVTIAPRLVEALLDEVQTGKVIVGQTGAGVVDDPMAREGRIETPYLQLVLTRLWDEEARRGSKALELGTFQRLGGAEGIVRTHLDAAMSALTPGDQDTAAQLFNHLVTPSGSKIAQSVSDLATYAELPDTASVTTILERLSGEVRILRPVGEESYEIYHDALAAPILDWRARWQTEQQHRRDDRRRRLYGGVALVSVAVAAAVIVLGILAINATRRAHDREDEIKRAASVDLADSALLPLQTAPEQAVRLALKAYGVKHTPEAVGALRAAVSQPSLTAVLPGGGHAVRGATFSPDGRFVATTATGGDTRVWTVATGRRVATLPGRSRGESNGYHLPLKAVFSPDGALVVTVGDDGGTRVWDTSTWNLARTLRGHRAAVLSAAFSDDGRRLVTAGADGDVRVREVPSWRTRAVLSARSKAPVRGAAADRSGGRVAVAEQDGAVSVWDVAAKRRIAVLAGSRMRRGFSFVANVSVAFSPDGRLLLSVAEDGRARLWDAARKRHVITVSDDSDGAINAASFSPDGKRFVTAADDGTAVVRTTTKQRKPLATLRLGNAVASAAFSPDGLRIVAAGESGTVSVWDPARPSRATAVLAARSQKSLVWAAAFSRDGRHVVTAGDDGDARLWDTGVDGSVLALPRQPARIARTQFSPDGRLVVTSTDDGAVRVWGAKDGRAVAVLHRGDDRPDRTGAAFSQDGRRYLTLSGSRAVVWDTRVWREIAGLTLGASSPGRGPITRPRGVFSPDGGRVLTRDVGERARLWNAATGDLLGSLGRTGRLGFSPDGKLVFTSGFARARFWRTSDLRRVPFPIKNRGAQSFPVFSPDGRLLATIGRGRVRVWDLASGERVSTLGRSDEFSGLMFSPDSRLVAIPREGQTDIWDATGGRRLSVVRAFLGVDPAATFSSDGQFLVASPEERRTSIAQSSTGQFFARVPGLTDTAAFSPTGARIAVGGADGVVRIYSCNACDSEERIVALAKQRLNRAVAAQRPPKRKK